MSLDYGCMANGKLGTIQHELMHAIGFWHEQSRADRDDYVEILWDNIDPEKISNFYKRPESQNLDAPYDYSSVMHYGRTFFSQYGEPTIVPKYPSSSIGQRNGLSEIDIEKINKLYSCSAYLTKKNNSIDQSR